MEQQDAKNLITLEEFLSNLEMIISEFKSYVNTTNKRIDELSSNFQDLSKRVNENTSICRELKRDVITKMDNFSLSLNGLKDDFSKSETNLLKQIESLKNKDTKEKPSNNEDNKKKAKSSGSKKTTRKINKSEK